MTKNKNESDRIREKKNIVLKNTTGKKISPTHILAIGIVLTAVIVTFVLNREDKRFDSNDSSVIKTVQGQKSEVTDAGSDEFTYDAAAYNDKKAKYYQYRYGNILIKYFILKSQDGTIRAAFDACDVCWPDGKGYAQQGDDMICRNCGQRFPTNKINLVKGGCNPSPLHVTVQNGKVIVKTSDIIQGSRYFDFSKKG